MFWFGFVLGDGVKFVDVSFFSFYIFLLRDVALCLTTVCGVVLYIFFSCVWNNFFFADNSAVTASDFRYSIRI